MNHKQKTKTPGNKGTTSKLKPLHKIVQTTHKDILKVIVLLSSHQQQSLAQHTVFGNDRY